MKYISTAVILILLIACISIYETIGSVHTVAVKVMTFNILRGGVPVDEIGASSPLYRKERYQDIAKVIIESDADIVGILEPNTAVPDPILELLQGNNPRWRKNGKLYAKYPIELDPYTSEETVLNMQAYRINVNRNMWVYVLVAHWRPVHGYGPMVISDLISRQALPDDLDQLEEMLLDRISIQEVYDHTCQRLRSHLSSGRPIILLGDFNEPSHLDWTVEYALYGADRWVNNHSDTPLRFDIEWRGSKTLSKSGMVDAFREIYPDPVSMQGNTWTPPYSNNTPSRRPYNSDRLDVTNPTCIESGKSGRLYRRCTTHVRSDSSL